MRQFYVPDEEWPSGATIPETIRRPVSVSGVDLVIWRQRIN